MLPAIDEDTAIPRARLALLVAVVALVAGLAPARADDLVLQHLDCRGNEPFWRVEANPTGAQSSRLVAAIEQRLYAGRLDRFDYLDPPWAVFRGDDVDGGGTLVLTARAERCLDTMADLPAFPWRAVAAFPDGVVATGCCTATFGRDLGAAPTVAPETKPETD